MLFALSQWAVRQGRAQIGGQRVARPWSKARIGTGGTSLNRAEGAKVACLCTSPPLRIAAAVLPCRSRRSSSTYRATQSSPLASLWRWVGSWHCETGREAGAFWSDSHPLPLAPGSITGYVTRTSSHSPESLWYKSLGRPSWEPPRWAFGVVWPLLYLSMGYASHLTVKALDRTPPGLGRTRAFRGMKLYYAQLLLNQLWTPLFFGAGGYEVHLGGRHRRLTPLLAHRRSIVGCFCQPFGPHWNRRCLGMDAERC